MKKILLPCLFSILLWSCGSDKLRVDVSDIQTTPLELKRLENDLFSLTATDFDARNAQLQQKYGAFYDHYIMGFLNRKGSRDSLYKTKVLPFLQDKDVSGAYQLTKNLYADAKMQSLLEEVNNMVKRFKYHFPDKNLPKRLITCTTGWNYAFAYMDSNLVVSLDMYLGDTSIYYQMLRYPQYQTRKMNGDYILPDIARGWLLTEFDNNESENTLLHHTIFYGKLFYAVNALLPEEQDSVIIGYSAPQMKYCYTYEKKLWGYFAEKNRLFENNLTTVRELTSEGPFTGAISRECPPRIAMWIGWRIVKSYMENNPKVTLQQLMQEQNPQVILNKSKYRP